VRCGRRLRLPAAAQHVVAAAWLESRTSLLHPSIIGERRSRSCCMCP
jgi:hypothetical protein